MKEQPQFQRTTFTEPDFYLLLRHIWIAANERDRCHFLSRLSPTLSAHDIEALATLDADEQARALEHVLGSLYMV